MRATRSLPSSLSFRYICLGEMGHCVCLEAHVAALLLGIGRVFVVMGMLFMLAWLDDNRL